MTRKSVFSKFLIVCCMCVFLADIAFAISDRGMRRKKTGAVQSEQRVALVIGNGDYKSSPLRNPVNDARVMSETLEKLGFEVTKEENLGFQEMGEAIALFGEKLLNGGVGRLLSGVPGWLLVQLPGERALRLSVLQFARLPVPLPGLSPSEDPLAFGFLPFYLLSGRSPPARQKSL